jgi:hypothetical protein
MEGISDALCDPAYATSVGLLAWGVNHERSSNWTRWTFGLALKRMAARLKSLFS